MPTIDGSFEIALTLIAMLATSLIVDRATHHRVPARYVAIAVFTFCIIFFASGTHNMVGLLGSAVHARGRTIFTPSGIQGFCADVISLASHHGGQVLILIISLYLSLQTFCIPGTIALNAAIGALVGTGPGVPIAVILGTVGASLCYLLSSAIGPRLAEAVDHRLMKGKGVPKLRATVQRYRSDLLVYMLFLRLTPVLPNWLINLASPVVQVPLRIFAAATFLGIIPQTYLSVRFGSAVVQATRNSEGGAAGTVGPIVTTMDTIFLCGVAVLLVVASRLKKQFGGGNALGTSGGTEGSLHTTGGD